MSDRKTYDSQSQLTSRKTGEETLKPAVYFWTIENIKQHYESTKLITIRLNSNHNEYDGWNVKLYPKGSQGNSDESELSIEFISSENNQLDVECSITFRKPPKYFPNCSRSFVETFQNGKVHVIRPFFTRAMMLDPSNLSTNGACLISFVMLFKPHPDPTSSSRNTDLDNPANCLIHDLSFLHDNPKMTDVIVNFGDVHYPVHKIILAARSPVFSAMFEDPETSSNQDNQININDFTPEVVKELLRYIYTDQVDICEGTVRDLLVAANKYGLENLKLKCSRFIIGSINNDNAAEILILADRENATALKADVVAYIDDHVEEIMETAGYTNLVKNHPHLLVEFVRTLVKRPRRV